MSKASRNIITVSIFILIIMTLIVIAVSSTLRKIVPDDVIGNTAGNLNNYGLFCEQDGYVYFANSYDEGSLYRMTSDRKNIEKIYNMNAKYINAGGDYVFFFGKTNTTSTGIGSVVSKSGMYMVKNDGSKVKSLCRDVSQNMLLVGNNLYYQHYNTTDGTTFAVIDLKKAKSTELLDFMINPSCYVNGLFYYNGLYDDHYLYSYNPATEEVTKVWEGDIWNPIYDGEYVYYMDVLHNYRLCRYSIRNNTIEILTRERLDSFNVYGNVIFYQVSNLSGAALMRMNTDGSNQILVAEGTYNSINVTSTYTYFYKFGDERTIYCTPTFGIPAVTEFTEAKQAVFSK